MLFTTCNYIKKNGLIKLGSVILAVYSISILCSIFLVNSRFFRHDHDVNFLAYAYWLVVFLIVCIPLFLFDKYHLTSIKYNYRVIHWILTIGGIISIIPLLEQIIHAKEMLMVSSFDEQIADAYNYRAQKDATDFLSQAGKIGLFIVRGLFDVSILFIYPYFREYKRNKNRLIEGIGLISIILCANIYPLFLGTRVKAVDTILKIVLYFVINYTLMKRTELLFIRKLLIMTLSIAGLLLSIMTIARMRHINISNQAYTTSFFLTRYAGEGTIIFSENLPYLKKTTNGDRCFYFVNYFIKDQLEVITREKRMEYETKLGVRTGVFYTFLGEFVYDIGWINTFLFMSFISFLMYSYLKRECKNNSIRTSAAFVLFIYAFVILSGFTMYRYSYERSFHYLFYFAIYCGLRFFKM